MKKPFGDAGGNRLRAGVRATRGHRGPGGGDLLA